MPTWRTLRTSGRQKKIRGVNESRTSHTLLHVCRASREITVCVCVWVTSSLLSSDSVVTLHSTPTTGWPSPPVWSGVSVWASTSSPTRSGPTCRRKVTGHPLSAVLPALTAYCRKVAFTGVMTIGPVPWKVDSQFRDCNSKCCELCRRFAVFPLILIIIINYV